MTREDFLKKIELSDVEDESKRKAHQKRIMERVDQGIKIFGYEDSLDKQEQWYQYCAKVYEECCIPIVDRDKMTQKAYDEIVKSYQDELPFLEEKHFSFPNFSTRLGETFDLFKYQMHTYSEDAARLKELQEVYANFDQAVDKFFERHNDDGTYSIDLINDIKKAIHNSYTINELANNERLRELNDTKTLIELSSLTDIYAFKIITNTNGTFTILSQRALSMLQSLIIPYYQSRFAELFDRKKLNAEIEICKIRKNKHTHVLVRELYQAFAKHGKVEYNNFNNTYHSKKVNGFYASLSGNVSYLIYELLIDLNVEDSKIDKVLSRKEKIDAIKNFMEADLKQNSEPS